MNFNHSRVEARNAEDGKINYVDNNSLVNSLTLSLEQQISSLGGTLSLQSYLYRLDQFDYKMTTTTPCLCACLIPNLSHHIMR